MTDSTTQDTDALGRFHVKTTSDSHFAWIRTRLAVERTMMAWIRTAVALIGFGFTIVQFFERLGGFEGVEAATRPNAPRYVGLTLIGAGVVVLIVSAWQYRAVLGYMWRDYPQLRGIADVAPHKTPTFAIAVGMVLVGVFAFLTVLFRAL